MATASLDDLITGSSTTTPESVDQLLTYPSFRDDEKSPRAGSTSSSAPALSKDRVYVGNLHPSVDEYTLVQVFSKFGKIASVDYLFHKSGPLKGKPRGYAFVKYAEENDAEKAISRAHDKLLRGRKIIVTYAQHAPPDSASGKSRRTMMEIGRPTTLSLLKSGSSSRCMGTAAKIARMEAKLRQLEGSSANPRNPRNPPSIHPSLPPKPNFAVIEAQSDAVNTTRSLRPRTSSARSQSQPDKPPSSLLQLPSSSISLISPPVQSSSASKPSKPRSKLIGVKIKPKEKASSTSVPPKSD